MELWGEAVVKSLPRLIRNVTSPNPWMEEYRKELAMDLGEKRSLLRKMFIHWATVSGFDAARTEELASPSGLVLVIAKSAFPNVDATVSLPNSVIQSQTPSTMKDLFAEQADYLHKTYTTNLRRIRQGG